MTLEVRLATHDDVAAIRAVGETTWPPTYEFAGAAYVARGLATWWSEDAVRRSLETTTTLVAEVDGELVGIGNLDLQRDPPTIWKLYVVPSAQRLGAGAALLRALVALAPRSAITLEYLAGNDRAAAFYERHDFREVAREPAGSAEWPDTVWMLRPATAEQAPPDAS